MNNTDKAATHQMKDSCTCKELQKTSRNASIYLI